MEHAQGKELDDFENKWRKRFNLFDRKAANALDEMSDSQEKELQQYIKETHHKFMRQKVKFSPFVLDLRERELALARCNRFAEASDLRDQREDLEREQFQSFQEHIQTQISGAIELKQIDQQTAFDSLQVCQLVPNSLNHRIFLFYNRNVWQHQGQN